MKNMRKDRGLEQLDSYLNNFSEEISIRLNHKNRIRILDAGCGYGVAMAGLIKKFGDKIELTGYNKSKDHGTIKDFIERSIKVGIFSEKEIKQITLPKIFYFDADKGLPFKDNNFDLIYSLGSVYLYKDKIKFFEECNRILRKNGQARIHLFEIKNQSNNSLSQKIQTSSDYKKYWEIWDNGKEILYSDYFKKINKIGIKEGKGDKDSKIVYLEINKQLKLDFGLRFVSAIDNNLIYDQCMGTRSIYTTQK